MLMTGFSNYLIVVIYSWRFAEVKIAPFGFLKRELLTNKDMVWAYMGLAVPSVFLVCSQWWATEILQLIATQLSVIAICCMAICSSLQYLAFQLPLAINFGTTSAVGNAVGAKDINLAKAVSIVAFVEGSSLSLGIAILTTFFSREIACIYTNDPELIEELSETLEAMSYSVFFIACIYSMQGTLKAAKMHRVASAVLMLCLFLVSLPMA